MNTKSVQLTADEIRKLIQYHAQQIINSGPEYTYYIDRMKYLDKRLKDFSEPDNEQDNKQEVNKEKVASSW